MSEQAQVVNRSVEVTACSPHPQNYQQHDEGQIGDLRASLRRFGQVRSIVVQDDGAGGFLLVAGHGVHEAAMAEGLAELRADVIPEDWAPARVLAYLAADNELARRGQPDEAQLAALVKQVADEADEELARLAAGSEEQLQALLASANAGRAGDDPGAQVDRAAELQEKWQVKLGDLWIIPSKTVPDGEHRVMCGDSTSVEDVGRLGIVSEMPLFTDPPYGINRDPSWLDGVGTHRQALSSRDVVIGDDGSIDLFFLWQHERRMVWGFPYIYDAGAEGWIVWDKQPGVDSRGIVTPVEMASTTMRQGFDMVRVMWVGYYRAAGEDKQPHPTQKPIGVYEPFVAGWTKAGEAIADYFAGSGVVIVVCERLGRVCYAMEIEPKFCAVTLERLAGMGLGPYRAE